MVHSDGPQCADTTAVAGQESPAGQRFLIGDASLGWNPSSHTTTPGTSYSAELAQLGLIAAKFGQLLEVGRSLGLKTMIGLQNLHPLDRVNYPGASTELLQLVGTLITFRMNPSPDSKRICEEHLTTLPVRTWVDNNKTKLK
jgi:hypothetical protein